MTLDSATIAKARLGALVMEAVDAVHEAERDLWRFRESHEGPDSDNRTDALEEELEEAVEEARASLVDAIRRAVGRQGA